MTLISLTVELVAGFFALLILMKILGKTHITQLTPFDFISSLIMGEIVGNTIYEKDLGLTELLYGLMVWGLLIYLVEFTTQKLKRTRAFLESKPSIVIRQGKIERDELKKNQLDLNQLQNLLRQQGSFSIREVEYAILESNGALSVLKKPQYGLPSRSELNIPASQAYLPVSLILDGEIIWDNLKEHGFSEKWLYEKLKEKDIDNPKKVFYAEWKENEGLYVEPC